MENKRTPEDQYLIDYVEFCMDYFLWEDLNEVILNRYYELTKEVKNDEL